MGTQDAHVFFLTPVNYVYVIHGRLSPQARTRRALERTAPRQFAGGGHVTCASLVTDVADKAALSRDRPPRVHHGQAAAPVRTGEARTASQGRVVDVGAGGVQQDPEHPGAASPVPVQGVAVAPVRAEDRRAVHRTSLRRRTHGSARG